MNSDARADRARILDEIAELGVGPEEPHVCDCGRWMPCRHCTKEPK